MSNLMLLFLTPFMCSLAALAIPSQARRYLKQLSFLLSLIPVIILIMGHNSWVDSKIQYAWISSLSIEFHLSIDSLSLLFLYLTAVIIPISILAVNVRDNDRNPIYANLFFSLILFLEGLLFGFFMARDLVLFTIFWEAILLPLFLIINLWGKENCHQAAIKFLIYMIAGSALMVAAVLFLYLSAGTETDSGTFNLDKLSLAASSAPYAAWLCGIFLLAFAVKTPLFPFHAWLPDAYYQAPTAGTILLSGLLSKAGIYGILRIGLELFPDIIQAWSPILLGLAVTGVFYGGFAAWAQNDFKRLIAYSSFSHVNLILVGLFVWNPPAQAGAILQAINHGITITALFLVSGWLETRLRSTSMTQAGGVAKFLPHLCWFTLIFVLSSVALPGTNNFVGELMIFFGLFGENPWLTAFLGLSIILSVVYMLRWMQKVYFGEPSAFQSSWIDIGKTEIATSLFLTAMIFWLGIYPAPVLKHVQNYTDKITLKNEIAS